MLRHHTGANDKNSQTDNDLIQSIELVDIDGDVVEQSKIHFPQISCGLTNPLVKVTIEDAAAFVQRAKDHSYDIIIIDTTDPEGPASELFGTAFYKNIMRILREDGVVCNQG